MDKLRLIFREYDIRGIAGKGFEPEAIAEYEKWYGPFPGVTITPDISRLIGRAYGSHLKVQGAKKVLVGYEVRPFADILKDEFVEGILDCGINVVDAGKTCTPFIYFLTSHLNFDGGVNITGSHNVYFFNGYKMLQKDSKPLYGEELLTLYDRIIHNNFKLVSVDTRGEKTIVDNSYEIYKKEVLPNFNLQKKLRVVIDCGNGTPGLFAKDFFESLGVDILEELFFDPDAKFPNHVPDPESAINMTFLIESVKRNNADIGIAFDADGDRVGFVDEKGNLIFADNVLMLLAKEFSSEHRGMKVLFDVKSSKRLEDILPELELIPLMHRTGHAPIKDTLRNDENIILGGELSGHFYFTKNYPKADDGFYAAATILELLSKTDKNFSELFDFIPKRVGTSEMKLPCSDLVKFSIIKNVTEELEKQFDVIKIDGARINFSETGWGLIRASNTSPYITVRVEGIDEAEVLKIKNIFADLLDPFSEIEDKLNRSIVADPNGRLGFV